MNKIIAIFVILLLTSCTFGEKRIKIFSIEKPREKLDYPMPTALQLEELKWIVITSKNAEEVFQRLEAEGFDPVLFGLTDKDYEIIAKNFAQIRAYLKEQNAILEKYRKYYEPEDEKKKEVKAEDDDKKDEKEKEVKKESIELEIDLSDDVKALVSSDADLSEEFKDKAATIFETAVRTRIKEQRKILEAKYEEKLSAEKETIKEAMTEKVDSYLNYVVEEWMKENELAVERGIRSELVEDFMTGLRNLFQEHYIDIPEEKVDLVDDLFGKVEELEGKLDEEINRSVDLKKELSEYKREETIREVSDNLADTEKEKLSKLAEGIEYEDKEQFNEKLGVLKENYFPTNEAKAETTSDEDPVTNSEELNEKVKDPTMTHYVDALARFGQNT